MVGESNTHLKIILNKKEDLSISERNFLVNVYITHLVVAYFYQACKLQSQYRAKRHNMHIITNNVLKVCNYQIHKLHIHSYDLSIYCKNCVNTQCSYNNFIAT